MGNLGVEFGKDGSEQRIDVLASTGRLLTQVTDQVLSENGVNAFTTTPDVRQDMARAVDNRMQKIRQDLVFEHINAVNRDTRGQHQFLSPRQITDYHHDVFDTHRIPRNRFGGTPVTGLKIEDRLTAPVWCGSCDKK